MEEKRSRKRYDRQFKGDAVRLIVEGGQGVAAVSRDLGVSSTQLQRWRKELEEDSNNAFPGKGRLKPADEELRQLRRELERTKEERDILKKALAFFSRNAR